MEYLDTPISIIYWKTQYGESLTVEETALWETWQKDHPGKPLHKVLHEELAFHDAFRKRRRVALKGLLHEIRSIGTVEERITPVVPIRSPRWYQQRRIVVAAVLAGGLAIGLAILYQSGNNKTETGQSEKVVQTVPRPAPSDTALLVELADGNRLAVGVTDTGIVAPLGSVQLRSKGRGQFVYEAVGGQEDKALINHTIITVGGKPVRVELADHSVAELAPQSKLQVDVSGSSGKRSVILEGLGYFNVTHDQHRPFVVDAAGVPVQVLGTEFVVTTADRGFTTVALEKGSVQVGRGHQRATLQPGQAVQVSATGDIHFVKDRLSSLLAFKENKFYYTDHSLATIIADIEQWYAVRVIDSNPSHSLNTYHFGPVPRDLPLTTVLEKLSKLTGHRFRYEQRP